MKKENKIIILGIFLSLSIIIIIPVISAQVGIIELAGTPEIVSCVSDKEVFSGDTYNSQVIVKNIGESAGEFSGRIECTGDVSGYGSSGFVESNSQISLPFNIAGTNTQSGVQNNLCTIIIEDSNGGGTDSCTFTFGVKFQPNIVCAHSSLKCVSGNTLRTCSSDGSTFTDTMCNKGEKCIVADDGTGSCVIDENQPQNNSNTPALIIALGIIAGLVILGLLIKKKNK